MKRLIPQAIGLALFISALLVNTIYADITDARMTATPGGAEMTQFASGISVVYVVVDYSEMHGEEFRIRVYDNVGNVLFEQVKAFMAGRLLFRGYVAEGLLTKLNPII